MAENKETGKEEFVKQEDGKYKCPCGYVYDPEKGDPKRDIPAGTKFEDLPEDLVAQFTDIFKTFFLQLLKDTSFSPTIDVIIQSPLSVFLVN